jgi:superfamily II DNA/RNA helicase
VARRSAPPTGSTAVAPAEDPLARFAPPVAAWFRGAFAAPTKAQVEGWAAIAAGGHVLLHAPTGSGKTLAAFLWGLDRLVRSPAPPPTAAAGASVRILYVSPLKALTYDVERNLRAPLAGIALAGRRLGTPVRPLSIASRTGDTPSDERRALAKSPPEILITTPESLYLLLTSGARETLRRVEAVIVDEVHAVAGTKRGAHLALSLERLEHLRGADAPPLQRIGLSATQRPLETIGRFLAGAGPDRAVAIVDAGARKRLDLSVVVPVEDMSRLGEALPLEEQPGGPVAGGEMRVSIWPAIHPRILELIRSHRSTLVFVNSRRLAERLAQRLNELAGEDLVRAHHGSIAREQRVAIEEALKEGRLPALVATSSLELGIDMGAIDLVIQVESPTSVARGLQRIGRAGHQVDEVSCGVIFPKYRGDLLECAVVAERMREGAIEATRPATPDVLAAGRRHHGRPRWPLDDLFALVRRERTTRSSGVTPSSRSSACWPASTRRTSSRSSDRASSGTGSRARSRRDVTRVRWPSRRVAPSPTAASSASTSRTTGTAPRAAPGRDGGRAVVGSASSTRRFTRRARARSSCSAPAPDRGITHDRAGLAGAGQPEDPILEAAMPWAALSAGRLGAFVRGSVPRQAADRERASAMTRFEPRPRRARGQQPARLPGRGARGDGHPADRPDDHPAALPRRVGRLADLPPVSVRRAGPCALGAGHRGPPA